MMYSAYRESWHALVHGVAKSRTRLSDWTELNSAYELNKQGDNTQKFMPIYTYISIYIYLRPPVSTQQNRAYSTAPPPFFYIYTSFLDSGNLTAINLNIFTADSVPLNVTNFPVAPNWILSSKTCLQVYTHTHIATHPYICMGNNYNGSNLQPRGTEKGRRGRKRKENKESGGGFLAGPVVEISPSNSGATGSIPGWGAKIPHTLWPKNWNTKHKQYRKKFNKGFKNGPHKRRKKKERGQREKEEKRLASDFLAKLFIHNRTWERRMKEREKGNKEGKKIMMYYIHSWRI